MPVSVMIFYKRHPDFSPTEFKAYMENKHVPLLKEVMGTQVPISYTRRYVERVESGAGDRLGAPAASKKNTDPTAPVVLVGSPEELTWDMMGEFVFRDELHLQQCYATINAPDGQRVHDDEGEFTVPEQMRIVLIGEITSS
jgi:hypothetical protein